MKILALLVLITSSLVSANGIAEEPNSALFSQKESAAFDLVTDASTPFQKRLEAAKLWATLRGKSNNDDPVVVRLRKLALREDFKASEIHISILRAVSDLFAKSSDVSAFILTKMRQLHPNDPKFFTQLLKLGSIVLNGQYKQEDFLSLLNEIQAKCVGNQDAELKMALAKYYFAIILSPEMEAILQEATKNTADKKYILELLYLADENRGHNLYHRLRHQYACSAALSTPKVETERPEGAW